MGERVMKELVVVAAALAIVACGQGGTGQQVHAVPAGPMPVVLATFEGSIDPTTGEMTLRSEPTPLAEAMGMRALVEFAPGDVSVANVGTPIQSGSGLCDNQAISGYGRAVRLTLNATGAVAATAVYAKITYMSRTGSEGCNDPNPIPYDIGKGYGIWSYGILAPGATTMSADQNWYFATNISSTAFTFAGSVFGTWVDYFDTTYAPNVPMILGSSSAPASVAAAYGAKMVYAGQSANFVLVDENGASAQIFSGLSGNATSIATDIGNTRIWYTTDTGYVGEWDVGTPTKREVATGATGLRGIVVDPGDATRAWFVTRTPDKVQSVSIGTGSAVLDASFATNSGAKPELLAFGANGNLYVTVFTPAQLEEWTTSPAWVRTATAAAGCEGPSEIIKGPDDNLWISANWAKSVCKYVPGATTFGQVVQLGNANPSGPLTFGSDGNLWVVSYAGNAVFRVTPTQGWLTTYATSAPGTGIGGPVGIVRLGTYLWLTTNGTKLLRLAP